MDIDEITEVNEDNYRPFLQPLSLNELKKPSPPIEEKNDDLNSVKCLLCEETFNLFGKDNRKAFLAHLIISHKLVISDVDNIAEFNKYVQYWRNRLIDGNLDNFCFKITTNSLPSNKGEPEDYYLLSDSLPEEKALRNSLKLIKLEEALKQQENERVDQNYYRECIFCAEIIGNNRSNILNHMLFEHNFNIGLADNLVYFDDFYHKLKERFNSLKCFYCEKIFYDKTVLKEHMRKKQHKCINPQNKEFDKYYVINYLETGKDWQDLKSERDDVDLDNEQGGISIDDWDENFQIYYCLFCDDSFEKEENILEHFKTIHNFDLRVAIQTHNLSFYTQVKLINYIRRKMYINTCFICKKQMQSKEKLSIHLSENNHIEEFPPREYFDQPEYLFSTFEDDSLLTLLDDSGYSKDEEKIKVIPEQYDLKLDDNFIQNFKDIL